MILVGGGSAHEGTSAQLWIRPGDGLHDQRLTTLDELHAKYPLPVELPQMMPDGYRLIAVYLIETGHRANPSGPSWLRAQYSTGENTSEIYFNQQTTGDNVDPLEGGEETRVDGARAFSGTRTEPLYDWLRWSRCGRLFELQSAPGQFSSADRIRIAESVGHEGC